jgi:5-methylthioadenosine/S-adenosylhomocysteine deaminase
MRRLPAIKRRLFLGGAIAFGSSIRRWSVSPAEAALDSGSAISTLPPRREYCIRGAYLMTMDPTTADVIGGDVHVRGGEIVGVGAGLDAPDAEVIPGAGMIVLPGLVETHWHMWNTLLRSMAIDEQKFGYFPTSAGLGAHYLPSDMFQGTRLSAAEALNAGITCVHDWCHNPRTPEHAEESLRALRESGIRARFSYGPARGIPVTQTVNLADIERLHDAWVDYSNEGLLTLGLAWRGVQYAVTAPDGKMAFQPIPPEVYRKEYETARRLGIPLTAHVNIGPKIDYGHVTALAKLGLLYKDLQLIHMISSTPEEIAAVAEAGSSVSFSPYTEMRTGFGLPKVSDYLERAIRVGLSVDTTALSGNADMFAIMKVIENIENGLAYSEFKMTARRVLELGTIGGARSMGLADRIGSVTKGKRADMIMISTQDLNLAMFTDPAHLVVGAAQPANVNLVMVDGRILKRGGKLVHLDAQQIAREAAASNSALRQRAGWW